MTNIVVYIVGTNNERAKTIVAPLFRGELFVVNIVEVPTNTHPELSPISARFIWALNNARHKFPDLPVMVVSDLISSVGSSDDIENIVGQTYQSGDFDMFYYAKWLDSCNKYTDRRPLDSNGSIMEVRTYSPHGLDAILFTEHARDIVLGLKEVKRNELFSITQGELENALHKYISNGTLKAKTVTPSLLIRGTSTIKDNIEYLTTAECLVPNEIPKTLSNSNFYLWFGIVIFFIVLLSWAALKIADS